MVPKTDTAGSKVSFHELGFQSDNEYNEWKKTPIGKIFGVIEEIAISEEKSLSLKGRGSHIIVFKLGDESAKLYKQLIGGSVAEDDGNITVFYESWEYQHFPWWKKAIDSVKISMFPLPFPLFRLAQDAGIVDWRKLFIPDEVIKHFDLNTENFQKNTIDYVGLEKSVISVMIDCLNPVLAPHYEVCENLYLPRITPLTDEAKLSLSKENETYRSAISALKESESVLVEAYKGLR